MMRVLDLLPIRMAAPVRAAAFALLGAVALSGCGGGAETAENPVTSGSGPGPSYSGPVPSTADIQAFRVEFWENVRRADRCGNCHTTGGQAPTFARSDDVNAAYQQAQAIVNRESPSQSALVLKVGGGHNCWLADPGSCATILTRWISNWVGASATGGKQIELVPPTPKDPGASRRFPPTPPATFVALYNTLRSPGNCLECHRSNSETAQSPFFASDSVDEAYVAAIPKINLEEPASSRFVVRLRNERHNCWTDCATDAQTIQNLIAAMSTAIVPEPINPSLVVSKALTLFDGTVASGGNRFENNQIALYEFKTGNGATAFDTSGVDPAANLEISGNAPGNTANLPADFEWVGGWGVMFKTPAARAQAAPASARKLHQLISATGEFSIEAWVVPANVTQEDAYIISYSGGNDRRNFTIGQTLYNYDFMTRSTATPGLNGMPALSTDDDDERLQASLQHVVMTFDPVNGRRIYVNGEFTGDVDSRGGGTLGEWDDTFALVVGNETSGDRPWAGVVRLVAVHNRALTTGQIQQNFQAGVGEKFFLLFGIEHIVNVPRSYVMFEAAQYDSAGYLFTNPKFISLDPNALPGNFKLRGMRIGLNGAEPAVGQAYRLLDVDVTDSRYSPVTGQTLSSVGTIISIEQGPISDEFFLCFDQLGDRTNVCSQYANVAAPQRQITTGADIGVRTFDEINATMAKVTGVDPNTTSIRNLFTEVRQSLPATPDIQAFLASHQSSITPLAIQYCHEMTNDGALRSAFYAPFNFPASLAAGDRLTLINPVIDRVMGVNLTTQPDAAGVRTVMTRLVDEVCAGDCDNSAEVLLAAKSVCAAALGSAPTLVK